MPITKQANKILNIGKLIGSGIIGSLKGLYYAGIGNENKFYNTIKDAYNANYKYHVNNLLDYIKKGPKGEAEALKKGFTAKDIQDFKPYIANRNALYNKIEKGTDDFVNSAINNNPEAYHKIYTRTKNIARIGAGAAAISGAYKAYNHFLKK